MVEADADAGNPHTGVISFESTTPAHPVKWQTDAP